MTGEFDSINININTGLLKHTHLPYFCFVLVYEAIVWSDRATPWLSVMIAGLAIFMFSSGKICKEDAGP
jgi:hypothetical protein